MKEIEAQLTLVGAGPGDPELITLKAIKALAAADVVLYDALIHPDLLEYAPCSAEKIFVGKRKGLHNLIQDEINALIIEKARKKGHVVRLKGGDPFIFGRGHEELVYARQHGIKVNIIPGVSSSTSLPALHGIPLTRRGISESFIVTTATTKTTDLSRDISAAASTNSTVVILMGLHKLDEIVKVFEQLGKRDLPIAIIQNGSHKDEKIVVSTIRSITKEVIHNNIGAPAIIVIGEVVRLHDMFKDQEQIYKEVENF